MNESRQMEVHYINTGFPYTITESFMDFFEDLTHVPVNYPQVESMQNQSIQENFYWSMNMNSYKFGFSGPESTSYYDLYEVNEHVPGIEVSRRAWEYPSSVIVEEPTTVETEPTGNEAINVHTIPEECSPNHYSATTSQALWQDNVDPDNMTYEELLDLGEAVGTQSRGLSQELINLLPTSRYKSSHLFSRKRSKERCVICQMGYKRGDRQINLPCKHVYHTDCGTKWLTINKVCPICNIEVFGEESRHK